MGGRKEGGREGGRARALLQTYLLDVGGVKARSFPLVVVRGLFSKGRRVR